MGMGGGGGQAIVCEQCLAPHALFARNLPTPLREYNGAILPTQLNDVVAQSNRIFCTCDNVHSDIGIRSTGNKLHLLCFKQDTCKDGSRCTKSIASKLELCIIMDSLESCASQGSLGGGGGAQKIMCAHAHHEREARYSFWPGSRAC